MENQNKELNLYQRIAKARAYVLGLNVRKKGEVKGKNKQTGQFFVKSHYFTPEQVDTISTQASVHAGIETFFDLLIDEDGYYGQLTILNIDQPDSVLIQHQRTDLPNIINANKCQDICGMRTQTERYMLQSLFRINTEKVDIDSIPMEENKPKSPQNGSDRIVSQQTFKTKTSPYLEFKQPIGKKEKEQLLNEVTKHKISPDDVKKVLNQFGFTDSSVITLQSFPDVMIAIESLRKN